MPRICRFDSICSGERYYQGRSLWNVEGHQGLAHDRAVTYVLCFKLFLRLRECTGGNVPLKTFLIDEWYPLDSKER